VTRHLNAVAKVPGTVLRIFTGKRVEKRAQIGKRKQLVWDERRYRGVPIFLAIGFSWKMGEESARNELLQMS
jgi:hypothetical protein